MSQEDREFAEDMYFGRYHFRNKNYRGAMYRFLHALDLKPGQPEATFRLAESFNKLGKSDAAAEAYQAYLEGEPSGMYAKNARVALERLKSAKTN